MIRQLVAPFADGTIETESVDTLAEDVLMLGLSGAEKRKLLNLLSGSKPDWTECRALIVRLVGTDLAEPMALTSDGVAHWYRQLSGDPQLQAHWGQALPYIIQAQVQQLAESDRLWKTVLDLLPDIGSRQRSDLPQCRGRAFERLCPLDYKKRPLSENQRSQLERDCEMLAMSQEGDRMLSKLLRSSLDKDIIRSREELTPYTTIVWELMGGQEPWDALYPLLGQNELEAWDQQARALLRKQLSASEDVETSVLKLYLQRKGADKTVKTVFNPWYRMVLRKKWTDEG